MPVLLLAVLAVTAQPSPGASAASAAPSAGLSASRPAEKPRTGAELREAIEQALRHWARTTEKEADAAARELVSLYGQLRQDTKLAAGVREQLRLRLRRRLLELSSQINARAAHEKRLAASGPPKSAAVPENRTQKLAQQGIPAALGGAAGAGSPNGGGPAADDNGQQLLDLIQTTIAPHSWDVNGGQGTIYYWQPGRAMVIRQTEEIHEQIGGAIQQVQKAGQ